MHNNVIICWSSRPPLCIVIVWIIGETPFPGLRNLWTIPNLHNCTCCKRYIIPGPNQVNKTPKKLALQKKIMFSFKDNISDQYWTGSRWFKPILTFSPIMITDDKNQFLEGSIFCCLAQALKFETPSPGLNMSDSNILSSSLAQCD